MKWTYVICALFLLGGLSLGLLLAFSVTRCIRSALVFPRVSLATVNDKPALVVSVQEHPPWAHSNTYGIDFDYDKHTIDVAEFYVLWHPFSPRVLGRPPVVIQQGLLAGSYSLRFWNGHEYVEAGHVIVDDKGNIDWHPKADAEGTNTK
jgi:hypothetical protein